MCTGAKPLQAIPGEYQQDFESKYLLSSRNLPKPKPEMSI